MGKHVHDHAAHSAHATHAAHHDHAHMHAPNNFGRTFFLAVALNTAFVLIEAGAGFWVNSVALLADAGHNLSDIMGLLLAWGAFWLAQRKPTSRYTYGFSNALIFAALLNAMLLMLAVGMMSWEAFGRLQNPSPVPGGVVMAVAGAGIVINGLTALLFMKGQHDLNVKGAYLHMVADALVSAGVVVGGAMMLFTGWLWVDAFSSLLIAAVIVWSTGSLLVDSLRLSMNGVPRTIDADKVQAYLAAQKGVLHVHDLHIWALSTSSTALTCHLVMPDGHPGDTFLLDLAHHMAHEFGIGHVTFQVETSKEAACGLDEPCGHETAEHQFA